MKRLLTIPVVVALFGSVSFAAPRTWTSSNGRFTTEAELLDFNDGKAQLKKTDGTVVEVPLVSLSAEDRQYIKGQFPGVEEEQLRPGAEYREWKSKNGKFTTLAEFLGYSENHAQLRKLDGSEISVDVKLLSAADQRWIAGEVRRLREEEAESKTTVAEEPAGVMGAQDISMKLLRLDPSKKKSRNKADVPADYVLRLTTPQMLYAQPGQSAVAIDAAFARIVHKEPKYNAPRPFRGVVTLGSRRYGLALDAVGTDPKGYNRLYFDANGNGDLTDDKPISAAEVNCPTPGLSQSQFPRVDIDLDVEGKPVEYAFLLSSISQQSSAASYTTVSLYSAAVREGYVTQGRKRTRLVLLDRNSNGRFDDVVSLRSALSGGTSDLLLVNPNPKDQLSADATMGSDRYFMGKMICIGKDFYRMEVTPAGDRLKLDPAKVAMGSVVNSSLAYRALLVSEDYGAVLLAGMKDQKVPLPEGRWTLANYTIDATGFTGGSRTALAATFAQSPPAVSVGAGETAALNFGRRFARSSRGGGSMPARSPCRWRSSAPRASSVRVATSRGPGRRNRISWSKTWTGRPFTKACSSMAEVSPAGTCGKYHPTSKASSRCSSNSIPAPSLRTTANRVRSRCDGLCDEVRRPKSEDPSPKSSHPRNASRQCCVFTSPLHLAVISRW